MFKKINLILVVLSMFVLLSGFSIDDFSIENLDEYVKEFESEEIDTCSKSATKTYMSYKSITSKNSKQYKYIENNMSVDEETGLLIDENGFIGVALGSYYGEIGSKFYITLDTEIVIPVVKVDAKSDAHTVNGCSQSVDGSVIEFVIDKQIAGEFFGVRGVNSLVSGGNLNNDDRLRGKISTVEKVNTDAVLDNTTMIGDDDIFIDLDEDITIIK